MTDADLQQLRGMLTLQRHALIRTLCAAAVEEQALEPAFVALLADVQTAIAAVEAELTEGEGAAR
jgi:hypothetical protein